MKKRISSASAGKAARPFPGAHAFTDLSDAPGNYIGTADYFVVVNHTANGLTLIPLPPLAITDTYVVNSQIAMLALPAQQGDVAVRTDINQSFILAGSDPSILGNWVMLLVSPTHALGGALHTADTLTHLNALLTDGTIISTKAGELAALTAKASPTTDDLLLIEDAADTNKKKKITILSLGIAWPYWQNPIISIYDNTGGTP